MGGPKIKRLSPASQPGLEQPSVNLLQSIFGGGSSPATAMQRGGGNNMGSFFQNILQRPNPMANPMAPGGNIGERIQGLFGSGMPDYISQGLQGLAGTNPGQNVVNAYQPIYQRNLALAQDQGARFSSGNELLRSQAMNDYNMFAANALQQGQQQQLQALLGAGNLSQQFQGPLLQQLLGALFKGGGVNADPIYNVTPGLGQQLLGLGGGILGGIAGAGGFNNLFGASSSAGYSGRGGRP